MNSFDLRPVFACCLGCLLPFGFIPAHAAEPKLGVHPATKSSYLIHPSGLLYVWGWNEFGQLSLGDTNWIDSPVQVPGNWQALAAGTAHTLAIGTRGRLFAGGLNRQGQLGFGTFTPVEWWLQLVPFPDGVTNWVAIAAGEVHSLGLSNEGQLYAWGQAEHGAMGLGPDRTLESSPTEVPLPPGVTGWTRLAAGHEHSFTMTANGQLYASGYNACGQLGLGHTTNQFSFALVPPPAGSAGWRAVAGGQLHTLGIADDGQLYGWGDNSDAQLGLGFASPQPQVWPVRISPSPAVTNWASVSCGFRFSMALTSDGRLFTWGHNAAGQIGNNSFQSQLSPFAVPPPRGASSWTSAASGAGHVLAIADDGRLYTWGYGYDGALGNCEESHRPYPEAAKGLGNFKLALPNPIFLCDPRFATDGFYFRIRSADPHRLEIQSTTNFSLWFNRGRENTTRGGFTLWDPYVTNGIPQFYRILISQ